MNQSNKFKKELEFLSKSDENYKCFDCDKQPAHWASMNNGIYLCLDCSGEHRGFGSHVSFIKSISLDQWNQDQFNLMKVGGNQRLKEFLLNNGIPDDLDKKDIYCSKIMSYYRRMLKKESKGEMFMDPMPNENEFWEPAGDDKNKYNNSNNNYNNNLFTNNNNFGSYNNKQNNNDLMDYPKNEIVITDDHYEQARKFAETASQYTNTVPTEPKFQTIDPKYKNDARYASIGSEPISSAPSSSNNNQGGSGYLYGLGYFLGNVWYSSVNAASAIKDKMEEYDVGNKLLYLGGKTAQAIAYAGGKMIEKGGDIVRSDTVRNLAGKAGEGIVYLKDKIVGGGGGGSSNSQKLNSYGSSSYSSTGSDDYYDRY